MTILSKGDETGDGTASSPAVLGTGQAAVDAVAEPLCVRFVNTVGDHATDHPYETLHSYEHLLRWGERTGAIAPEAAEALRRRAEERPEVARQALARAVELREAIYRVFVARIHGRAVAPGDLDILNAALAVAPGAAGGRRLALTGGAVAWGWAEPRLDLWPQPQVAWSAADTLTSEAAGRVGQCADERGCGWLFLDTSRNRSRRWCSMGDCGNRAKQRRHIQRHAGAHAGEY